MQRRDLLRSAGLLASGISLPSFIKANPKSITPQRVLRVAHITDVHIQSFIGAAKGFEKCLHHIQNQSIKPDFIINSGDCIMDAHGRKEGHVQKQWKLFNEVLKTENSLPIFHSVGNHDICCEGESATNFEDGKKWAMDEMGMNQRFYSFDKKDWHFVMLDSVQKKKDGSWYTANLDETQFDWLKNDLRQTSDNKPTMVISHIPILAACVFFDGNNMKEQEGRWEVPGSWMHTDSKKISELFDDYKNVKLAVSGHIHLTDKVDYNDVTYCCNGAVSGRWWSGKYQHTKAGYAIIDLYDNGSFTNQYVNY
jgi:3',5'-cyclic-AMP phosphodiesterase